MKMVLDIGSPSEAWRALSKIADETEDDVYDRAKRELETLEIGANESVSENFARVNIVLMKLERHNIITPAREIKRIVLNSLTPRFPNETCMYGMKGDFELKKPGTWAGSRGELPVGSEKERPVPRISRCPCGRRPNRDLRWSPWTKSAGQALRRAPRRR